MLIHLFFTFIEFCCVINYLRNKATRLMTADIIKSLFQSKCYLNYDNKYIIQTSAVMRSSNNRILSAVKFHPHWNMSMPGCWVNANESCCDSRWNIVMNNRVLITVSLERKIIAKTAAMHAWSCLMQGLRQELGAYTYRDYTWILRKFQFFRSKHKS